MRNSFLSIFYEEALKNVQVIISEWIETAKKLGREVPRAKGRLVYI